MEEAVNGGGMGRNGKGKTQFAFMNTFSVVHVSRARELRIVKCALR